MTVTAPRSVAATDRRQAIIAPLKANGRVKPRALIVIVEGGTLMKSKHMRVAILHAENRVVGRKSSVENELFSRLFQGFADSGVVSHPVAYHDDNCHEVEPALLQFDGVLVWVDPLEGGRDRTVLDAMLRRVASAGVFVSAHPDVILKIGTKEVLYSTREVGWGCDTHIYLTPEQMCQELPRRLASGEARVLKQYRGNGGIGVWRVQLQSNPLIGDGRHDDSLVLSYDTPISVRQAIRGAYEEVIPLGALLDLYRPYFVNKGSVIDQAYQERLVEGMIRCYLAHNQVVGFGHQAVNALFPAPAGAPPSAAPQPGPRLYHPPSKPEFQSLKSKLEQDWLPAVQKRLCIDTPQLPIIWDCDFLLGKKDTLGADTYVLCEINASCVSPFPEEAIPYIVASTVARLQS